MRKIVFLVALFSVSTACDASNNSFQDISKYKKFHTSYYRDSKQGKEVHQGTRLDIKDIERCGLEEESITTVLEDLYTHSFVSRSNRQLINYITPQGIRKYYKKVLDNSPDDLPYINMLAFLVTKERYPDQFQDFIEFINISSPDPFNCYILAILCKSNYFEGYEGKEFIDFLNLSVEHAPWVAAKNELALTYLEKNSTREELERAVCLLQDASNAGYDKAITNLGNLYIEGLNWLTSEANHVILQQNIQLGLDLLKEAYGNGDGDLGAAFSLACFYEEQGEYDYAIYYYNALSDKGFMPAKYNLALMLEDMAKERLQLLKRKAGENHLLKCLNEELPLAFTKDKLKIYFAEGFDREKLKTLDQGERASYILENLTERGLNYFKRMASIKYFSLSKKDCNYFEQIAETSFSLLARAAEGGQKEAQYYFARIIMDNLGTTGDEILPYYDQLSYRYVFKFPCKEYVPSRPGFIARAPQKLATVYKFMELSAKQGYKPAIQELPNFRPGSKGWRKYI